MGDTTTTPTPAKDERGEPTAPVLPAPPVAPNGHHAGGEPAPNGSTDAQATSLPAPPTQQLERVMTSVAGRAETGRRRKIRVAPRLLIGGVAGVLATVLLVAVTHGPAAPERASIESFASRGVSFTYLSTLHRVPGGGLEGLDVAQMTLAVSDAADAAWREVFAMRERGVVLLFGRDQPYLVREDNLQAYESAVAARYRDAGIEVPRMSAVSVGGLPALSSIAMGTAPSGAEVQIRTTEIFAGATGYILACQATPGGRAALMAACDAILRSIELETRRPTAGWTTLASPSGSVRLSVPPGWQEADSVRPGTRVAASLPASAEGTTAARVEMATVRLRRPVPTGLYADVVADRMKRYLVGRGSLRIARRPAEMMRFEDKDAGGVFYVFVDGRTAYAVRFDIPIGNPSFTLLRPTMEAIAGTLQLR